MTHVSEAKTPAPAKKPGHSTRAKGTPLPPEAIAPKKKMGRPTVFRQDFIELARRLTLLKASYKLEDMANVFQVSLATLKKWMVDHPDFSAAIARAKDPSDSDVADALYRSAVGYTVEEEQLIKIKVGGVEEVKKFKVRKHYPPNPASLSLWLRNRKPDDWKANPEPGDSGANQPVSRVTVTIQKPPSAPNTPSDSNSSSPTKATPA